MKQTFFWMLGIAAMFASCSQDDQEEILNFDPSGTDKEQVVKEAPCLTFSSAGTQTFGMRFYGNFTLGENEYFEYSVGNGEWKRFTTTVSGITFGGTGGDLRLRGKSSQGTAADHNHYAQIFTTGTAPVDCQGDIRTLIDYENYETVNTANARFCYLFQENSLLRTAPKLPATTLASDCYFIMFQGCSSLTTAPELPATTLAPHCYADMFWECTSLTTAPELPATTLAPYCYSSMFMKCTSLTTAPELPATTLTDHCYERMFDECSSLTTAPELPATTLAPYCYSSMFAYCSSLTTAPELPATTLAPHCYADMFWRCSALTTAPELPATTLAEWCYVWMFSDCSKLSEVKMLATDVSATSCLGSWLFNAGTTATTRTLTLAHSSMYNKIKSKSELPAQWQSGQATIKYTNP